MNISNRHSLNPVMLGYDIPRDVGLVLVDFLDCLSITRLSRTTNAWFTLIYKTVSEYTCETIDSNKNETVTQLREKSYTCYWETASGRSKYFKYLIEFGRVFTARTYLQKHTVPKNTITQAVNLVRESFTGKTTHMESLLAKSVLQLISSVHKSEDVFVNNIKALNKSLSDRTYVLKHNNAKFKFESPEENHDVITVGYINRLISDSTKHPQSNAFGAVKSNLSKCERQTQIHYHPTNADKIRIKANRNTNLVAFCLLCLIILVAGTVGVGVTLHTVLN